MDLTKLATRSLIHFWRSNLTIAIGVAAATAVLTGALIVGDSMRGSLKQLTFDRLADVDEILISKTFFREDLTKEITANTAFRENYRLAVPVVFLPNCATERGDGDDKVQVVAVNLFGCNDEFWKLDETQHLEKPEIGEDEIVINRSLADALGIEKIDETVELGVRLPILGRVPSESALGEKEKMAAFVGELKVIAIIEDQGLGRFSMYPSQLPPRNAYMSLSQLQGVLAEDQTENKSDPRQVNTILFASRTPQNPPPETVSQSLVSEIKPTLEDFDLRLKRVKKEFEIEEQAETIFDYLSVSSDQMIMSRELSKVVQDAIPNAQPVMTYLANRISVSSRDTKRRAIPFSMVSSIDFGNSFAPVSAVTGKPIEKLGKNEIVLNSWTAEKLDAKVGDEIEIVYFEPETTDGDEVEQTAKFKLIDIVKVVQPDEKPDENFQAPFSQRPTLANDPFLTPYVPGLTDSESINDWELPFETPGIKSDDDIYWKLFRTTPKAFVSLETGRQYWSSRFGDTTSFRVALKDRDVDSIRKELEAAIWKSESALGFELIPIKRQGLKASSGTTPFDALFLSLSAFVIIAALLLVSILFRLSLQQRSNQIGILSAVGLNHTSITKAWTMEMVLVSFFGALFGVGLGIGYAALMILGLRTWWVGAISTPFIELHVGWVSLLIGLLAGTIVCLTTIAYSVWRTKKQSIRGLLAGKIEVESGQKKRAGRKSAIIAAILFVVAIVLAGVATQLGGQSQAGAFLGGGFCTLAALLIWVWNRLSRDQASKNHQYGLGRFSLQSLARNPLRSVLTIGVVAAASFLIVSISAFRLSPSEEGTAGFDWIATTEQPILEDLNNNKIQEKLFGYELEESSLFLPVRLKSGQDASCNNPYKSNQPRVLGVSQKFIDYFDGEVKPLAWASNAAKSKPEKHNPWRLLNRETENTIPVVIDKNTAWFSLQVYFVGSKFEVNFDSGESATFEVVGFLDNTILQGSLLISEKQFVQLFPQAGGYRYFLTNLDEANDARDSDLKLVRQQLSDYGLDLSSTEKTLAGFLSVQNTYLSTFQVLGALGLLLGTFGLAAVQTRSVLERKRELALMRAIGFDRSRLGRFVLLETCLLLLGGLGIGVAAAAFVTLPHWLVTRLSVPWVELVGMFAAILIVGLATAWLAARWISKLPILGALRN